MINFKQMLDLAVNMATYNGGSCKTSVHNAQWGEQKNVANS